MLKRKTLILHVGPPKTGSTAIQATLMQYKDKFAQEGVCISEEVNDISNIFKQV